MVVVNCPCTLLLHLIYLSSGEVLVALWASRSTTSSCERPEDWSYLPAHFRLFKRNGNRRW